MGTHESTFTPGVSWCYERDGYAKTRTTTGRHGVATRSRHRVVLSWPEVSAGGLSRARETRQRLFPAVHRHPGSAHQYTRATVSLALNSPAWGKIRMYTQFHTQQSLPINRANRVTGTGPQRDFPRGPIDSPVTCQRNATNPLRHALVLTILVNLANRRIHPRGPTRSGRPTRDRVSLRANA